MNTVTILFLRASPFLGSPEKLILSHLKYIAAHDCKYVVGAFNEQMDGGNDFLEALSRCGVKAYALKESPINFFSTLRKIIRVVRDENIEIICTQDYKSDFFGLLARLVLKIPIVAVFHGRTSESARMHLYESIDDHLLRYFDRVIAVSHESGKKLARIGVKPLRMRVIPNGIDADLSTDEVFSDIRREFSLDDSDPLVIFAGRLSKEKGLDVLMEAAARVVESFPSGRFMILGDGREAPFLKARARELGLEKNVIFPGFRRDIQAFYSQMDVCVLPSFTEGMPLVILEAFVHKKPVVASNVGGVPELVEQGVSGYLVEPGDARALAERILDLLRDPEKARHLGMAGYERVRAKFGVDRQVKEYTGTFRELARRRTRQTLGTNS